MAKLTARGCYKVGQVTADLGEARHVFALRNDGKVLRRLAGFYRDGTYDAHATGYNVWATLKANGPAYTRGDVDRLAKILERKGFQVREVKS